MRLAAKLVALLAAFMTLLLLLDGWLLVQRTEDEFEAGMRHDATLFGKPLGALFGEVWMAEGEEQALALLPPAEPGRSRPGVRWVWLDAGAGGPHAPRVADVAHLVPPTGRAPVGPFDVGDRHCLYLPVDVGSARRGALELSESASDLRDRTRTTILRALLLTLCVALLTTVVILTLGVRLVGRRLDRLMEKVRRVGAGDLAGEVDVGGRDELTELAVAMNRMSERLAAAHRAVEEESEARLRAVQQLRHADRLRTVGQLASGLAHELGTPLNVVSARAGIIRGGDLDAEGVKASCGVIRAQCERMSGLIRQLLDFARPAQPAPALVDPAALFEETRDLVEGLGTAGTVRWRDDRRPALPPVLADGAQLRQVLTNLLVNAQQAMPHGGAVEIDVRQERAHHPGRPGATEQAFVVLEVADHGVGIPPRHLSQVFDPFFTTKDVGSGTGLGLSVAHGIVHEHGGFITVESEPGRGSVFRVYLPRVGDA